MSFYKFSLSKFTFMFIYNLEGGYEYICFGVLAMLGYPLGMFYLYIYYINLSAIYV